jgi:hypothetical protein
MFPGGNAGGVPEISKTRNASQMVDANPSEQYP